MELCAAPWDGFDLEGAAWRLPAKHFNERRQALKLWVNLLVALEQWESLNIAPTKTTITMQKNSI